MRPIVLPATDYFLTMLIDSGRARVVKDEPRLSATVEMVVQPRYEYIFKPWPLAKIEVKNIAELIAEQEAKHATKH